MKTFWEAQVRAGYSSLVIAGGSFFTTLATGATNNEAFVAAGGMFFLTLATRGLGEGVYDAIRDRRKNGA